MDYASQEWREGVELLHCRDRIHDILLDNLQPSLISANFGTQKNSRGHSRHQSQERTPQHHFVPVCHKSDQYKPDMCKTGLDDLPSSSVKISSTAWLASLIMGGIILPTPRQLPSRIASNQLLTDLLCEVDSHRLDEYVVRYAILKRFESRQRFMELLHLQIRLSLSLFDSAYLAHKLDKTQFLVVANLIGYSWRKNYHIPNIRNHSERLVVPDLYTSQIGTYDASVIHRLEINIQQRIRR